MIWRKGTEMSNDEMVVLDVPMEDIFADPNLNCRGEIVPFDVIELSRSIEKNGLMSPITVQPYNLEKDGHTYKYRVIVGHRRHKSHVILNRKTIKAIVKTGLTELQARILNLQENLERKNLNILQEALAVQKFKLAGYTMQEVAQNVGMSTGWVQVRFALLDLEPEIQKVAEAGFLTQEQVKDIYSMSSSEERFDAVKQIKESKLKGEKKAIKVKKPKKNPLARKVRNKDEIFEMNEFILDNLGSNLATRALAWAAGEISDLDLYRDMKKVAEEEGLSTIRIPDSVSHEYLRERNYSNPKEVEPEVPQNIM